MLHKKPRGVIILAILMVVLGMLLAFGTSCTSSQSPTNPVSPATAAAPVAPTTAATATPGTGVVETSATTAVPTPTATRVFPTATPASTGGPQYGGTLRFTPLTTWDSLDPGFSIESGPRPAMFVIYNNLVQQMADGTIGPDLATSWDISADGKIVTFHLQKGVKFQDGTPLNAQAVKWNYDRYLDQSVDSARYTQLHPPLDGVTVVDDNMVQFNLSAPFRPLLATLSGRSGQIASPTAVQKDNSYSDRTGKFGANPVGSGPFLFKNWALGAEVDLVKNPNYWDSGKPYLYDMKFIMSGDKAVEFAMLRTGEIDIMQDMSAADAEIAKNNASLKIIQQPGTGFRVLRFRLTADPWTNHDLIAAMAYAIDRNALVKVLYNGYATPAYSPIGPAYGTWFDPTIKTYAYDPQKAKDMLSQGGDPNGFTYTQYCSSTNFDMQYCEALQSMFSKVGITANIESYNNRSYWSDFVSGKIKAGPIESLISPRPDPHINIQWMYACNGYSNPTGFCNADLDKLINQAAETYDVAKAKDLYHQILTTITEQGQDILLVYETNLYVLQSYVRNFAPRIDNVARLRDVWFAK